MRIAARNANRPPRETRAGTVTFIVTFRGDTADALAAARRVADNGTLQDAIVEAMTGDDNSRITITDVEVR